MRSRVPASHFHYPRLRGGKDPGSWIHGAWGDGASNTASVADAGGSCRVTNINGVSALKSVVLVFVFIVLMACLLRILASPRYGIPALIQNVSVNWGLGGMSVRPSYASTQPTQSTPLTRESARKAVLIGINYIDMPNELAGCIDDVRNVERVLRANGFSEITVLTEVDALHPTRENILTTLRAAAAATKPGDVLFVHYSGHGGLVSAPWGVTQPNGRDSTLIPLDFYAAGHIKDYEIRRDFINTLPAGSTLLLVVDACHSGTIADLKYTYSDASFREIALRGLMVSFGFEDSGVQADDLTTLGLKSSVELSPHKVAHLAAHYHHKKARNGAKSPTPPKRTPLLVASDSADNNEKIHSEATHSAIDEKMHLNSTHSAIDEKIRSNGATSGSDGPDSHSPPAPLRLHKSPNRNRRTGEEDENDDTDDADADADADASAASVFVSSSSSAENGSASPSARTPRVAYHSPSHSPYTSKTHAVSHGLPKYADYFKPDVSRRDHIIARQDAQKEFLKTKHEWKSRDVVPVEEPYEPTAATVVVLSGCKDSQNSADTAFDSLPSGAATWAMLCALCGSFTSTTIQPISLHDLLKTMRGFLSSAGYTQTPCISAGTRMEIDRITVRQLLKLD